MKTDHLTLGDLVAILKKRILPILLVSLLLGIAGFALRALLPATYSADATFSVRNMQSEEYLSINGLTSSQLAVVQTLAKEYAIMTTQNDALLDRAIDQHGLDLSREELRAMLTTETNSTMFTVTATAKDAETADASITAIAAELPQWIQETAWPAADTDYTCVTLLRLDTPAQKSSDSPFLWAGLFALGGFVLSYLIFLFCFLFCNRFADAEEIARTLDGTPHLATIPLTLPPADAAEAFYALREQLPHAGETGAVVISLTSALPREGTSFVAVGLATSLAVAGKRVLLVDADLRNSGKEPVFMPEAEPGFSEFLARKVRTVEKLIHKPPRCGFDVLPAGRLPVSPSDHPLSERMEDLLVALEKKYDYILVDFPAYRTAPDAAITAALFDGTLVVAAPRKCGARELRTLGAAVLQAGGEVAGVVVNQAPRARHTHAV